MQPFAATWISGWSHKAKATAPLHKQYCPLFFVLVWLQQLDPKQPSSASKSTSNYQGTGYHGYHSGDTAKYWWHGRLHHQFIGSIQEIHGLCKLGYREHCVMWTEQCYSLWDFQGLKDKMRKRRKNKTIKSNTFNLTFPEGNHYVTLTLRII